MRDFRDAAAGGVQQFQQGPVPAPKCVVAVGRTEEPHDHRRRQDVGNPLPQLLTAQQFRQILLHDALQLQVADVHAQGHDVTRDTGRRQLLGMEPGDEVRQVGDLQRPDGASGQPCLEAADVAPIGDDRVGGQPALARQVLKERLRPATFRSLRRLRNGPPEVFACELTYRHASEPDALRCSAFRGDFPPAPPALSSRPVRSDWESGCEAAIRAATTRGYRPRPGCQCAGQRVPINVRHASAYAMPAQGAELSWTIC